MGDEIKAINDRIDDIVDKVDLLEATIGTPEEDAEDLETNADHSSIGFRHREDEGDVEKGEGRMEEQTITDINIFSS